MKLTFINVGYGEAILIEHQGYNILIDGGGNLNFEGFPYRIQTHEYLKNQKIEKLDLVISTHFHEDHICGLVPVVRNCKVSEYWCIYDDFNRKRLKCSLKNTKELEIFYDALNAHLDILEILKKSKTKIKIIKEPKEQILLCSGLILDILGPSEEKSSVLHGQMKNALENTENQEELLKEIDKTLNEKSIIVRLTAEGKSVFLSGDATAKDCLHLKEKQKLLESNVLKLGHHGQIDSIEDWFLKQTKPEVVVTCASEDRRYNSANPKVYEQICDIVPNVKLVFSDNVELEPYTSIQKPHSATEIYCNKAGIKIEYV